MPFIRIPPILLDGFSPDIQIQQAFDTSWGAAWLTKAYTNVDHELFRNLDSIVFRSIRYGNNVAVLFGALMECAEFYDLPSFWQVISQGFSANGDAVKAIVTVLSDARRAVRHKYTTSGSSQTARFADEWIEFLDHRQQNTSPFKFEPKKEADLRGVAAAYFQKQQKQWLNAAWVPRPDRADLSTPQLSIKTSNWGQPASGNPQETSGFSNSWKTPRLPPSFFTTTDSLSASSNTIRSNPRKRSASPQPDRTSKQAKTSSTSSKVPTIVDARTKVPLGQSAAEASSSSRLISIKLPAPPGGTSTPRSSLLLKSKARTSGSSASSTAEVPFSDHRASVQDGGDVTKLKARIAALEKELTDIKSKAAPKAAIANKPQDATSSHPAGSVIDPQELKTTLSTISNAVYTLMESSHHMVDGLHKLQEDFSVSNTETSEPKTLHQALARTEKHLKSDYDTLMKFYHDLPAKNGTFATSATEKMAEVLAALDAGMKRVGECKSLGDRKAATQL
ncbi:hypothetical protein QBC40DRAFT_351058 [Triangularia verruculosa]|uniref:Uncharacterized protein n=1 Tax=Triangularia verruculosa TaxID=2587418 RepID=A0AAN7AS69_9PEZI|nr:hypothetical protein QBC40DRAFT_351058 [Triangularia verruculosa]